MACLFSSSAAYSAEASTASLWDAAILAGRENELRRSPALPVNASSDICRLSRKREGDTRNVARERAQRSTVLASTPITRPARLAG